MHACTRKSDTFTPSLLFHSFSLFFLSLPFQFLSLSLSEMLAESRDSESEH